MGLYDRFILPRLIDRSCAVGPIRRQREKVVPLAAGRVLEIGFGSGHNLPYFDPAKVQHLYALEPSAAIRRLAAPRLAASSLSVEFLDHSGDSIPLDDHSVDCVLITYTLCSIPDAEGALAAMRRVLRPDGRLIFSEHGLAPDPAVARWQHRLTPLWRVIGGGCHLDRPISAMVRAAGFSPECLDEGYIPGPRFTSYNYWGMARAPAA